MSKLIIRAAIKLAGEMRSGGENAALKIIPAALMVRPGNQNYQLAGYRRCQ